MNTLQRRIKAVEKEIKARSGGMFLVHYKDGKTQRIKPGDSISLCLNNADKVERFEEEPGGNNGILKNLVNGLLHINEEDGKEGII